MMKQLLRSCEFLLLFFTSLQIIAQERTITGKVSSTEDGSGIPGVSISTKGSNKGTTTNAEGKYSISVPQGATLVFSFVGMQTEQIKVGSQSVIDVKLQSVGIQLDEAVVTAYGISKDKATLGYATQTVKGDELAESQRENFFNAIQGRIAGATVNSTSGAPGASSQIVLRGFNSLSGNNSPLIVVDGLPINNSTHSQSFLTVDNSNRNNDYTNRAADINPADIEAITVLKGPEATALYGIDAGSGALIITTKKGTTGKMKVSYDNSFRVEQTYLFPEVQNTYGLGNLGDGSVRTLSAFGPKIPDGTPVYDNVRNFFQDAFTQKHNLTFDGGKKRITYRASVSSLNQTGTIPNTAFDRINGRATVTYESLTKRLLITGTGAYTNSYNKKALRGGGGFLQSLILWPVTDDASAYLKENGLRRRFFDDLALAESDNPFWTVYKNSSHDQTDRFNYNLSTSFKVTTWMTLTAKGSYDGYKTFGNTFYHPESNAFYTERGQIENYNVDYRGLSGVFLATGNKEIRDGIDFGYTLGTAIDDFKTETFSERVRRLPAQTEYNPTDLSQGDQATYANSRTLGRDTITFRRLQGVFGEIRFNYKKWFNLSFTGRNDWTSTLPKASRSFFYPSASMAFVFSDLIAKDSKVFSFGKLRASLAETAKDISPYQSQSVYAVQPTSGGGYAYGFTNNNPYIRPEKQRTYEVGTELQFWGKRLGLDFTYYNTLNLDQIVRLVRLSYGNGFVLSTMNLADTRNRGIEFVLSGQPIKSKNLNWDVNLNMSGTRNKVLSLIENIPEYYNADTWLDAFRNGLIPNSTTTTITGQDYLRNANGQIIIDPGTGYSIVNPNYQKIAERNPDMMIGLQNTFTIKKNFSLSFLLDIRKGGDIMNGTEYWMTLRGYSTRTLDRETPIIIPGVLNDGLQDSSTPTLNTIQILPYHQSYYQDGRLYSSNFVEKDVNWIRMRDLTMRYRFPTNMVKRVKYLTGASVYFTATDLFILSNYSGPDPSVNGNTAATAGIGAFGIDYFSPSTPRTFNVGLRLDLRAK